MKKIKCIFALLLLPLFIIQTNAEEEKIYTHVHIVDYDHPLSFDEIKARYTSYDTLDGNITDKIRFQSDYEEDFNQNELSIKNYSLLISVTNTRNHTTKWEDQISVRDFTAPIVETKDKEISIDISKEKIGDALRKQLIITDNYDTTFENCFFEGVSDVPGSYSIVCYVKDSSGNTSNRITLFVHIYESIKRQLVLTPILLEDKALAPSELLTLFLQANTIDESYQNVEVQSTYFDTPQKEGIYQLNFVFDYVEGYQQIYQCKLINSISKKKKKDDKIIYISLGSILFLFGIGIIIYRKRR